VLFVCSVVSHVDHAAALAESLLVVYQLRGALCVRLYRPGAPLGSDDRAEAGVCIPTQTDITSRIVAAEGTMILQSAPQTVLTLKLPTEGDDIVAITARKDDTALPMFGSYLSDCLAGAKAAATAASSVLRQLSVGIPGVQAAVLESPSLDPRPERTSTPRPFYAVVVGPHAGRLLLGSWQGVLTVKLRLPGTAMHAMDCSLALTDRVDACFPTPGAIHSCSRDPICRLADEVVMGADAVRSPPKLMLEPRERFFTPTGIVRSSSTVDASGTTTRLAFLFFCVLKTKWIRRCG
jgi:hypothetical protein